MWRVKLASHCPSKAHVKRPIKEGVFKNHSFFVTTRYIFIYSFCCLLPGAWGSPIKGNADKAVGIFDICRTRVGCGPASGCTLLKALCRTCPVVGRRTNKTIRASISNQDRIVQASDDDDWAASPPFSSWEQTNATTMTEPEQVTGNNIKQVSFRTHVYSQTYSTKLFELFDCFAYCTYLLYTFIYMCNIEPKCCFWKKGVRRKRNTQTWNLRKKNSCRFYSLGLRRVAARKVRFIAFFLPLLGCDGGVVDTFLSVVSWQAGYVRIGVSWTSDAPV